MHSPLELATLMIVLASGASAEAHRSSPRPPPPPVQITPNTLGLSARLAVDSDYVPFDPHTASITAPHGPHLPEHFPVPPPAINVAIELRNDSPQPLQVRWAGDDSPVTMHLVGVRPVVYPTSLACTDEFRTGNYTTIAPGATVRIPVRELVSGGRCAPIAHYATRPGVYWLDVSMTAHVVAGATRAPLDMGQPVTLAVNAIPFVVAR